MLILELGLSKQIEGVQIDPFANDPELIKINPLGKVPVLLLENNTSLFNSPLICRYLITFKSHENEVTVEEKWNICRWEALADGMVDASYNLVMEQLQRPEHEQSPKWILKWTQEIKSVLDKIESDIKQLGTNVSLAHLAIAAAIGYLDFRHSSLLYEGHSKNKYLYPKILTWYENFKFHPCMQATMPK
jgi:glutathione S-transferase